MHWLGHLWAWFNDPIWMIERRDLRKPLPAPATVHTTSMAKTADSDIEWTIHCSCGWSRVAYYSPKDAAKVRAIADRHEDRKAAPSAKKRR
jgi:hypothetical protein